MLPTRASRLCHELCVCVYVFGLRQIVHKIRPRILALRYNKRARADIKIIYTDPGVMKFQRRCITGL